VVEKAFQAAPPELQALKNRSLAWIYQYSAQQYLQRSSNNIDGINQAGQKLWMAIRLYPKILLEIYGQSLSKWFIKQWILARLPLRSS
jgi:hypothetical protein